MKTFNSGKLSNQSTFKTFEPGNINKQWSIDDMELLALLSIADRQLGRLDMYSDYIPDIDLFISMHVAKEATKSSNIEGTKTTLEETLHVKTEISEEKKEDWDEVQNYILALNNAINRLDKLPFSTRLIKETHKTLLKGVRGKHKTPGNFRRSQNWIGGNSISTANFIPPDFNNINSYMSDLEKFAHNESFYFPDLLKIALIHYQFETIHPFLDGNGRVGRLMITLYLIEKGILKKPILYLSDFFEKNKSQYYSCLTEVRNNNDINSWLKFFLKGVIETAKSGIDTFDGILKLQKEVDVAIQTLGSRTSKAQMVINQVYKRPFINAKDVAEVTQLSAPSVYKLLVDLERLEILEEVTGGKRSRKFVFKKYLGLFR